MGDPSFILKVSLQIDEFLSFTQNMFSQIETYKITDGKIEPGVKGYEHGHSGFTIRSALLMVDADFCR